VAEAVKFYRMKPRRQVETSAAQDLVNFPTRQRIRVYRAPRNGRKSTPSLMAALALLRLRMSKRWGANAIRTWVSHRAMIREATHTRCRRAETLPFQVRALLQPLQATLKTLPMAPNHHQWMVRLHRRWHWCWCALFFVSNFALTRISLGRLCRSSFLVSQLLS